MRFFVKAKMMRLLKAAFPNIELNFRQLWKEVFKNEDWQEAYWYFNEMMGPNYDYIDEIGNNNLINSPVWRFRVSPLGMAIKTRPPDRLGVVNVTLTTITVLCTIFSVYLNYQNIENTKAINEIEGKLKMLDTLTSELQRDARLLKDKSERQFGISDTLLNDLRNLNKKIDALPKPSADP